jgi:TolB-like protein/Tfp pilus assembly protein PilF
VAALHISLLGGFEARLGSGEALSLKGRKTQALLAYLALTPGKQCPRDELVALLWGDRGEQQARSSLRQSLSELRKALDDADDSLLIAGRDAVALDADAIDVDVSEFEQLIDDGTPLALERAAKLYRGDLLDGNGVHDPAFENWLRDERQRLNERACQALSRLLDHQAAGDTESAIATARRLLTLDPLREATHRALMRLYSDKGERTLALKQYQASRDVLAAELGLSPGPETEKLAEEIRTGPAGTGEVIDQEPEPRAPKAEPLPLPDKPSIAVLPFVNMSGDPEQEYFADGITEDIITNLSRFRDLFVIASHSSFAYKGKAVKIQDVSRELGARYILEGSVQKSAGRVRIAAQLVDGHTGGHLWAERYDRQLEDIFVVQDEVAEMIVGTLASGYGGRLRKAWQRRAERKGTENFQAFDCFMRGMDHFDYWTKEGTQLGRECFQEAIRLDPNYAKAYAKLAWAHIEEACQGWDADYEGSMAQGLEIANKSIACDDAEPWGHWALAGYHVYAMRHDLALAELERAIELNVNDADVLSDLGFCLAYAGRAEDGLEAAHKAMRLNPHHPEWYVAQSVLIYHDARRYEAGLAAFARLRSFDTTLLRLYHAACTAALGRDSEAEAAIERVLQLDPEASLEKWTSPKMAPYKEREDLEHFRQNLRKAGLPD